MGCRCTDDDFIRAAVSLRGYGRSGLKRWWPTLFLLAMAPSAFASDAAPSQAIAGGTAAIGAAAIDAQAIVEHGKGEHVPACAACHGVDGAGKPAAGFPRLAGLNASYMYKRLGELGSVHSTTVMQPTARALSEVEREALADYFSKLPLPAALATPTAPMPPADSIGAVLATRGRWSQQLPACDQCHGPAGVGVGASFPPLAGQSASYIVAQLKAWKQGKRHSDPLQLMQHVSQVLDDDEMVAVASWYAAQPLDSKGATP